jgi:hypothetical protein
VGEQRGQERPGHELGGAAAARPAGQRPLVVALDEADRRLGQQGAEQADDEARPEVGDVGVAPHHDVAPGDVEGAPQRLALAPAARHVGEDVGGVHDPGAGRRGGLGGLVGGVVVEHEDLVDQADPVDQVAPDLGHDGADGRLLVVGGDAHRHDVPPVALRLDQPAQGHVAVVPGGDRRGGSTRAGYRRR